MVAEQRKTVSSSNETNSQEGGCQCGALRYKTQGEPVRTLACHCTTCKLRTGAPYGIGVYFQESQFEYTQGQPSRYEFHSDTSGRWIRNEFCPNCACVVSWTLEMRAGMKAVAGGSYDNPQWFDVTAHIWTRSARKDMVYPAGMKVCEEVLE